MLWNSRNNSNFGFGYGKGEILPWYDHDYHRSRYNPSSPPIPPHTRHNKGGFISFDDHSTRHQRRGVDRVWHAVTPLSNHAQKPRNNKHSSNTETHDTAHVAVRTPAHHGAVHRTAVRTHRSRGRGAGRGEGLRATNLSQGPDWGGPGHTRRMTGGGGKEAQ